MTVCILLHFPSLAVLCRVCQAHVGPFANCLSPFACLPSDLGRGCVCVFVCVFLCQRQTATLEKQTGKPKLSDGWMNVPPPALPPTVTVTSGLAAATAGELFGQSLIK